MKKSTFIIAGTIATVLLVVGIVILSSGIVRSTTATSDFSESTPGTTALNCYLASTRTYHDSTITFTEFSTFNSRNFSDVTGTLTTYISSAGLSELSNRTFTVPLYQMTTITTNTTITFIMEVGTNETVSTCD